MTKLKKSHTVRVIGGQWRGRRLPVLSFADLRPSTDRVRETVFNWLMHDISDRRCCDLFAGSGALGIECLSRGAKYVYFNDAQKKVVAQINANLTRLYTADVAKIAQYSKVECKDVVQVLCKTPSTPFDVIFLDPPFDTHCVEQYASLIKKNAWLTSTGLLYVEYAKTTVPLLDDTQWNCLKQASAGRTAFALYQSID